ncbi:PDZ domain-containing protein [Limnoglobus roseus]|uniref:PDZ domain-containing protein n=1 Tax=Limnoglobus roseus TaxID=2598579 RepID=A0A5C1ABU5_9BACT|nr:PDZ domain-containing protein [Limnoglobus roseus]QEL15667.1 hypothetical protein PX52LOC_02602 [Limnoglobus roseus]
MKAKTIALVGVALLMTTVTASAQRRAIYSGQYAQPNTGFGVVTPFGNIGNPYGYGTGYNNSYGYGNNFSGYNNTTYGRFNQQAYSQPYPNTTYSRNSYYAQPNTFVPQGNVVPQGTVVPGTYYTTPGTQFNAITPTTATAPTTPTAMGLRITEVKDGGAAEKAGLHTGDVILSVDGQRTQSFDELRSVLKATDKTEVKVLFWCTETGKKETKNVAVKDSKVGISVEETPVNETKVNQ